MLKLPVPVFKQVIHRFFQVIHMIRPSMHIASGFTGLISCSVAYLHLWKNFIIYFLLIKWEKVLFCVEFSLSTINILRYGRFSR